MKKYYVLILSLFVFYLNCQSAQKIISIQNKVFNSKELYYENFDELVFENSEFIDSAIYLKPNKKAKIVVKFCKFKSDVETFNLSILDSLNVQIINNSIISKKLFNFEKSFNSNILMQNNILSCEIDNLTQNFDINLALKYNCIETESIIKISTNLYQKSSLNEDFSLPENSICINSGDPDSNNNGFPYEYSYDLKPFGARFDIGAWQGDETNPDGTIRYTTWVPENEYPWVSLPVLPLEDNDNTPISIDNAFVEDEFEADWLINLKFLTDGIDYEDTWSSALYLKSSDGFSAHVEGSNSIEGHYPLVSLGTLLDEDIEVDVEGTKAWVGYWKPQDKDNPIDENFNSLLANIWDRVMTISSDSWYYQKGNLRSSSDESQIPSYKIHKFEFGKSYKITFDRPLMASENFIYNYEVQQSEDTGDDSRKEVEFYQVNHKSDYEALDIMDIPEGLSEIGVFENGECVGAVAVDEPNEQVLVYSDRTNRSENPFEIEFYDGSRSAKTLSYKLWNSQTNEYENRELYPNRRKYNRIKLGNNSSEAPLKLSLENSYPNPFMLSSNRKAGVTISYFINNNAPVNVSIYNLKGQKVKTIYDGNAIAGKHSLTWDTKTSNNKQVASGVYFYKVTSGNESETKKMMIIK